MKINIDELTVGQLREIVAAFGKAQLTGLSQPTSTEEHPFTVGANYFIRTNTHHHTGKLVKVYPTELVLTAAAWIADDGRFTEAVATGEFTEVEVFPATAEVIIGRSSIIDMVVIPKLPTTQK